MQDHTPFPVFFFFVYYLIPITLLIDSQKHDLMLTNKTFNMLSWCDFKVMF